MTFEPAPYYTDDERKAYGEGFTDGEAKPPVGLIVWQGEYGDYDDHSVTEVFLSPHEAYKAIGFLTPEGEPVRKPDHRWSVNPMRLYATHAEAVAADRAEADKWTSTQGTYEFPLQVMQSQAYIECYYLPAVIQKYIDGKRLDKHERLMLGMEEP